MKIKAVDVSGKNYEIYQYQKTRTKKEWEKLVNKTKSVDAVRFYKSYGEKPKSKVIIIEGEPKTMQEAVVKRIYEDCTFEKMMENFPEDFVETRVDYEELLAYANEMKNFIDGLKDFF